MQTAMLSGRWRLDSVAGKRWYGTGAGAIVAKSGTGYRYTKRYFTISGDNVPWARSKSPLSRIQQINPGGSITIVGTGSKVFGDSVSNSSAYEMLIGTVTHTAGHTLEHHTAWSGCVPGKEYSVKTLPVAEMWIVDGRDSLLKRYEYGKFHSLTRPTRISLGLKDKPAMAEQRFTAYTLHLSLIHISEPTRRS